MHNIIHVASLFILYQHNIIIFAYMYMWLLNLSSTIPHMQGVTVFPDVTYGAIVMLLTTIPYL